MKYKCLSIAGFDGSGGAGIQADLKTFSAMKCYSMTVLTSLSIQNTCGVRKSYPIPLKSITEQLECIFDDIIPDSIKIGLVFSSEVAMAVYSFLSVHAKNIPIVLDPVTHAKSGDPLLDDDCVRTIRDYLIPLCTIVTPNFQEACALTGIDVESNSEEIRKNICEGIIKVGAKSVLLKGGHPTTDNCNDTYMDRNNSYKIFESERIDTKNTHGTGCTMAAAICALLAKGTTVVDACFHAKNYIKRAIYYSRNYSVGHGCGPVYHFHNLW